MTMMGVKEEEVEKRIANKRVEGGRQEEMCVKRVREIEGKIKKMVMR